MADQIVLPHRVLDTNGDPASGALIYTYETGTDTDLTTYTTAALTTAHPNPIVCDANGHPPQAFYSGSPGVRLRITNSVGTLIDDMDPALSVGDSAGASQVTFTPITGNTATTVQAAIANNTASIIVLQADNENARTPVVTGGSSNAYTLTAEETIAGYSEGQTFLVIANHDNTGAATLNVDGQGAINWFKVNQGGTPIVLVSGDIQAGGRYLVYYDGTQFITISPVSPSEGIPGIVLKSSSGDNTTGTTDVAWPTVAGVVEIIGTQRPVSTIATGSLNGTGTPAWNFRNGFGATVTDNGAGDYTVAFDAAEADTDYTIQICADTGGVRYFLGYDNKTTSGFDIRVLDSSGVATDLLADISVTVSR